jgi:exopolysaccharide production protein ExoQ
VLSLALYVIFWNYLESLWMRGFEFLWVVFLVVAADISRYCVGFSSRPSPTAQTSIKGNQFKETTSTAQRLPPLQPWTPH